MIYCNLYVSTIKLNIICSLDLLKECCVKTREGKCHIQLVLADTAGSIVCRKSANSAEIEKIDGLLSS
jgi:hypothetical protein